MEAPLGAGKYPEYYYWDGKVIQDTKTGLWHLFADRWDNSGGFGAWVTSQPHHASGGSSLFGKFTDTGVAYTNGPSGSTGHNSSVFALNDGTFGLVASEVIPFSVWTATSLDGPWTLCPNHSGELFADPDNIGNCSDSHSDSNVSIVARADDKFEAVQRHGRIAIADSVCGPYNFVKPTNTYPSNQQPSSSCLGSVYPNRQTHTDPLAGKQGGPPQNIGLCNTYGCAEDPHIWYSGGMYHILYDYPDPDRVGYHLYSSDGMKWSDGGFAYDPRLAPQIFGLVGSTTVNQWNKMERPAVVLENGHVVAVTWAVSDVDKNMGGGGQDLGPGTNHGSKVLMAAFDGASMDCDLNPAACNSADGGATGGASGSADAGQAGAGGSAGAARVEGRLAAAGRAAVTAERVPGEAPLAAVVAAPPWLAAAPLVEARPLVDMARAARYSGQVARAAEDRRLAGPGPAPARAFPTRAGALGLPVHPPRAAPVRSRGISGQACAVRWSCSGLLSSRCFVGDRAPEPSGGCRCRSPKFHLVPPCHELFATWARIFRRTKTESFFRAALAIGHVPCRFTRVPPGRAWPDQRCPRERRG